MPDHAPTPDHAPFLRFPDLSGDRLVFVADDDLWLASLASSGEPPAPATRLTAGELVVSGPKLSPDGSLVAYTGRRDGAAEAYLVPSAGGEVERLTYWGDLTTRVLGWDGAAEVLVATAAGEPFATATWARRVGTDGTEGERLAYGPVSAIAVAARGSGGGAARPEGSSPGSEAAAPGHGGDGRAVVLGVNQSSRRGAAWKRYRGGTAAALWIDPHGEGQFERFLTDLDGQLEDPCFVGDRLAFLSDHEGVANLYSVLVDGSDLRRHSDHADFYARALSSDGRRLVYQCAGDLYLVEELTPDSIPRRLQIRLGGAPKGRRAFPLKAAEHLGELRPDQDGRASVVELRGSIHLLTHRDGPAVLLGAGGAARGRLPRLLGPASSARAAFVTDADGEDGIELVPLAAPVGGEAPTDAGAPSESGAPDDAGAPTNAEASTGGEAPTAAETPAEGETPTEGGAATDSGRRRLATGQLGRVLDLACAPDGSSLAVATHDGRVLLVETATGAVREVDRSVDGHASGLSFSPDSRLLAWSHAGPDPLRQIRLARLDEGDVLEATPMRFVDHDPAFTPDGKHLAFLSVRTFDPLYDAHVFDLVFASAARPYLLTLAADTPSPFAPDLRGRPPGSADGEGSKASTTGAGAEVEEVPRVALDPDGLQQRLAAVPVAAGRYSRLRVAGSALLFLAEPLVGVLGEERPTPAQPPARPRLVRYDLAERREKTILDELDSFEPTGDGRSIVVRDGEALRVLPADHRVEPSPSGGDGPQEVVEVDLGRLRHWVEPVVEWRQMYEETARLMRDHYFAPDMSGVDWDGVVARYRPLVGRLSSRDDLSELLWELQGELGTSHAYERAPAAPPEKERRVGHLGADLSRVGEALVVTRVLPGESSVAAARSPLALPGARIGPGDELVAVDGRAVNPGRGIGRLLLGAAERPVRLRVRPAGGGAAREVAVVPLEDERALRYQSWVAAKRAAVHQASGGRVGYLHVPDMVGTGWAELHRDLRLEVRRQALVVDVRNNRGGHVSELVIEKLARTVRGFDLGRHKTPLTYPTDAPRGPLVAICDEYAGSDGDIVTAAFKLYGLGPVVGKRTWGGVVGIDLAYQLVDGTSVTQPRYAFWFTGGIGWGVENHGVDPDVEVDIRPQDWAAGADPQLERAVALAVEALEARGPVSPPDVATRPSRIPPPLGPRP